MNGLPKDFSIEVFNKELEDLADRVNALLKECKDSLCDELEPPLSKDRGDGMTRRFDHNHTPEIVCPYCGFVHTNSWGVAPGDTDLGDINCVRCDELFMCVRHSTYSTEVILL